MRRHALDAQRQAYTGSASFAPHTARQSVAACRSRALSVTRHGRSGHFHFSAVAVGSWSCEWHSAAALFLHAMDCSDEIVEIDAVMEDFEDFALLRQLARHDFVHLLESMEGVKDLVVEPSLMRPLDRIANMTLLQQHNCAKVQQFVIGQSLMWGEASERRVYLVRPTLANAKHIADQVRADPDRKYSLIFVYRRLYICELELERNGVFGLIDIYEFNMPLLALETDLLTLELPEYVVSTMLDGTNTWFYPVARALWQLQSVYGLIPTIYGLGENASHVYNLMQRLYGDLGEPRASANQPISHLLILDRTLDLVPVLLTGLTYESLLNDTFAISCGKVIFGEEVEARLKQGGEGSSKPKVHTLNGSDQVFAAVRNRHMTDVFPFLSDKAKVLQASYDKGVSLNQVADVKKFVSTELRVLKEQHRSLELHICACEVVLHNAKGTGDRLALEHAALTGTHLKETMTFLEDCMCQQLNQWQVAMLAALYSVCQNGIPSKEFETFRSQFVQSYGCQYLPALHQLMKIGLLTERISNPLNQMQLPVSIRPNLLSPSPRSTFQFIAKRMNLIAASEPATALRKPDKMSYVFSGVYIPALCQVVADALLHGWNGAELKKTFGEHVFSKENSYTPANRPPDNRIRKVILVFFLGGVTYAEIAALRLLAEKNNFRIAPRLHVRHGSRWHRLLQENCPTLGKRYVPTWWLPFGSAQTAVRQIFRSRPTLPFQREIITFDDGGQLATDWLIPDVCDDSTPIVLFLPGITGSTHDCSYILHAVIETCKHGFRSVVICPRGLGGVPLITPRTYNAAVTEDLAHVITLLRRRYPKAPKLGVGFSMGGMILWNFLSKCQSAEDSGLKAALIISSPWDPMDATFTIEALFPRLFFNSFLAKNLRTIVEPYKEMFESRCDWSAVMSVRTVREFDKAFVVPTFGYRDWVEYYHDAALYYKVHKIVVPTLCLNAADDCFSPLKSIPFDEIAISENVAVAITQHGGHTAFMKHSNPNRNGLIEELLIEFSRMVFAPNF